MIDGTGWTRWWWGPGEGARDRGAVERAARAPLALLSAPYAAGARLHRWTWESGLRRAARLPCAVVAVGSPLVGGTGKTPLAAWIAAALQHRGRRVAVASRGSGRSSRGRVVVSDGERLLASVSEAGDEATWLAARLPGIPVVVASDRAAAGRYAVTTFGIDTLVLDDGLQHHGLQHDVGIATLDGGCGLGNGRVLPWGPLREPLSALDRADALGIWRVDDERPPSVPRADELRELDRRRIETVAPGLRRVHLRRRTRGVRGLGSSDEHRVASLRGLSVGVLVGLANPARFIRMVEALGARVCAVRCFADHHRYRARDLRGLAEAAAIWLTSEKDALKLDPAWLRSVDVRVLSSAVEVDDATDFLDWLEQRLDRGAPARRLVPPGSG